MKIIQAPQEKFSELRRIRIDKAMQKSKDGRDIPAINNSDFPLHMPYKILIHKIDHSRSRLIFRVKSSNQQTGFQLVKFYNFQCRT